jgi:von Willebrand factor A domain-containing protein 7
MLVLVAALAFGVSTPLVTSDAQTDPQQNRSRQFGPRACGPADPTYIRIANETGGQPFFLGPTEVAESAHIMRESSLGSREMILWASGLSERAGREFAVPIDSSVQRFTIAASFDRQGGTLNVIAADGTVNARPQGSEETILNCAHVLTVDRPATGGWSARIVATGRFWLVVHARSDLSLDKAEFVRASGRPGHTGHFRIEGQPVANRPATLRARTSGAGKRPPAFALISAEGRLLHQLELTQVDEEEFVGPVTLPDGPFRVAAIGTDTSGLPYQRVYAPMFHAELVELSVASNTDTLPVGSETAIPIIIRNHGPAARFQVVAADSRGRINRVEPQAVDVAQDAEATVNVWLNVPAGATPGSAIDLTVTAESTGARHTMNSVTRQFTVAPAR